MAHASAQLIGDRSHQCDATATYTHAGTRAYVLCDGIGSSDDVQAWTSAAARRVAQAAARRGDAEAGLRAVYDRYAAEPARSDPYADLPNACAAVAVAAPGKPLTVAWCGDVRAYVLIPGRTLQCLTADHNMRRVFNGSRNRVTSYLGAVESDDQCKGRFGHPAIESATAPTDACRLLLASDGAYEPLEDSARDLAAYLGSSPKRAAGDFVAAAIEHASSYADNATVLVADLPAARSRE
ncbi:PP2C family serine/threonine-protein phosphatase [Streptomyces sp. V4I2]|uniref:PP2C family protein-serine/threonine phosphatase n=1 Tax=Streptomyces sp. V4I2 TaxID=3042280 RepID=UPI0027846045|nr:mucin-2 [Streptomyces sp. V4I2]MDQ1051763.1 serine/threonine protein phosphatase PrpC [Streptomyces sp. V4I2]